MLLPWLPLVWYWQPAAGTFPSVLASQHAYSFETLPSGTGILPASADVQTLPGVSECECRVRCLSESTCRGYGHSNKMTTCLLTELLPPRQMMEDNSEDWRWHARNGVRRLDEPCAADWDCSLLVPAATCVKSICGCHGTVEKDGKGGCQKAGSFVEVRNYQLTSGLLSETKQTSINSCNASCAGNLSCVAFHFSASEERCRMFAEGITSETGPNSGIKSYVWSFARPDGTPPDAYQQVGVNYLSRLANVSGLEAADACFADNAILFPGVSGEELVLINNSIGDGKTTVWIGLEDMVEEGHYVTSDGRTAFDVAWATGEPNGSISENCTIWTRDGIRDTQCNTKNAPLCQYVGENLALGRTSWMNALDPAYPASNGNDGNINTFAHTPQGGRKYPTPTWTVDLGGPVQVTSVLYVARLNCCTPNRNRLTEIRVGSDPVRFDEQHSARCVWLEKPFMAQGYARLFRCPVPLTGRFVRLIRDKKVIVDFAELAVFGNRLQTP